MCLGNNPKPAKKSPGNSSQLDFNHIFTELEAQLLIHRSLMMQRLVTDPFYRIMNLSSNSRFWMLRHLPNLAEHAESHFNRNLLQFFERMPRSATLKYLRFKNAPAEMIVKWEEMHPLNVEDSSDDSNDYGAPPRKRRA